VYAHHIYNIFEQREEKERERERGLSLPSPPPTPPLTRSFSSFEDVRFFRRR
jgi:hypothetical protein